MDVDVVIPVRNRAKLVAEALASVRAQSVSPRRVYVVDDGSTDDTRSELELWSTSWDRIRVICLPRGGVSRARNVGLAACEAPLVAFLDSDDLWHPRKLERQVPLFDDPAVGFVHCGARQIDLAGSPIDDRLDLVPSLRGRVFEPMIRDFYHVFGSASAVVARRSLLVESGGFDPDLSHSEDQDLWLKLADRSHLDFVADVLVDLRQHDGNAHSSALATDPIHPLIQRLTVWNKWRRCFADHEPTLAAIRGWVVAAARARRSFPSRPIGAYLLLVRTRLPLVRMLFPNYAAFRSSYRDPQWH